MSETAVATKEKLPPTRAMSRSVQRDNGSNYMTLYIAPWQMSSVSLPRVLPAYSQTTYHSKRNIWLLTSPMYEGKWANVLGIAGSKVSSMTWAIDSVIPKRRKDAHNILLEAGASSGIFGWVPFSTVGVRSYLATGLQFIEIERATAARGGKVINIHHLDPLRCILTGRNDKPVGFLGLDGKERLLNWWQVMIISDTLPVSDYGGYHNAGIESAGMRAWNSITELSAIGNFIYERVSGTRPLKLTFVKGIGSRQIQDAMSSFGHDANRKGVYSYLGAAIIPIMGDIPLEVSEVSLADLPDITNVERERLNAELNYANSVGLDPQEVNPNLLGRQGLGSTGNQSQVISDKQSGRGLSKYQKDFANNLNQLMLDNKTTFSFSERDLRDEQLEADNADTRQGTRKSMIETGMITPDQARNLAVDDSDLPPEFLKQDETGGDTLRDDEKEDKPKGGTAVPESETPTENTQKDYYKEARQWLEDYY